MRSGRRSRRSTSSPAGRRARPGSATGRGSAGGTASCTGRSRRTRPRSRTRRSAPPRTPCSGRDRAGASAPRPASRSPGKPRAAGLRRRAPPRSERCPSPPGSRAAGQGRAGTSRRRGGDPDRDVDIEDPSPTQIRGHRPADGRADGERRADRGAVDGERLRAFLPVGEGVGEQRERRGEEDRRAEALHRAGGVEHDDAARCAAPERRRGEDREPDHEEPPPPEAVGDRPRGEHDRGERDRVGVHDPLEAGDPGVEAGRDVRQRRVDHGDVEHQHGRRETHDGESSATAEHGNPFRCGERSHRGQSGRGPIAAHWWHPASGGTADHTSEA